MISQLERLYDRGIVRTYEGGGQGWQQIAAEQCTGATYALYHVKNNRYEVMRNPYRGRVNTSLVSLKGVVYIAGPMSGYPKNNFPAFDRARDSFIEDGYYVISPADMDRVAGITEDTPTPLPPHQVREAFDRDCNAICRSTHIALLKGWESSRGVQPEAVLSKTVGVTFLDAATKNEVPAVAVCAVVGGRMIAEYQQYMKTVSNRSDDE